MIDAAAPTTSGRRGWLLVGVSFLFTAALLSLCWYRSIPLGVVGEWVWNRLPRPALVSFVPVVGAAVVYLLVCAWGRRKVENNRAWAAAVMFFAMLAAIPFHWALFFLPPAPLGPERWLLSLENRASSGYFSVAKYFERPGGRVRETASIRLFLRNYESWIANQDSFHIGTHPPGLFIAYMGLLRAMEGHRELVGFIWKLTPPRLRDGLATVDDAKQLSSSDIAALVAAASLAWLGFWLSAPLVYLLGRLATTPSGAFSATALWLAAPGPLLFMPLADVGYVLLSAALVVLLLAATRAPTAWALASTAIAACLFLLAINFSLAFTVVLVVAGVASWTAAPNGPLRSHWWDMWVSFFATLLGLTIWMYVAFDFNLFKVLWINVQKHRGFYEHFPRSYWPWVGVNLIEFSVTLGVLTAALIGTAWGRRDKERGLAWAFITTLLILDLSGKNLSEAGRLWLFLTPLAAAAAAPLLDVRVLSARAFQILLLLQLAAAVSVYACVEPLLPVGVTV